MSLDCLKNLLTEVVLLKQMPELQNRYLIRDTTANQIKQGLAGHELIHFGQELPLLGAIFGGVLLVIGKAIMQSQSPGVASLGRVADVDPVTAENPCREWHLHWSKAIDSGS